MTPRELKITRAILTVLHDADYGQRTELQIHAEGQLLMGEKITLAEMTGAVALCERRRWITGVKSKFTGIKYNVTDAGESALLEMEG